MITEKGEKSENISSLFSGFMVNGYELETYRHTSTDQVISKCCVTLHMCSCIG